MAETKSTLFAVMLVLSATGCVRRTLTINTEPSGAAVFLNDEPIGVSPTSRDFTFYGDYDVIIRKDGFETLQTNYVVAPPWYQLPLFDFFADVLWPGQIHDHRTAHFSLQPRTDPEPDELLTRALEFRQELDPIPSALQEPSEP